MNKTLDLLCDPDLLSEEEIQRLKNIHTTAGQYEALGSLGVYLLKVLTAYETQKIINYVQKVDSFVRLIESYVELSNKTSDPIADKKSLEVITRRYIKMTEADIVKNTIFFDLMNERFDKAIDTLTQSINKNKGTELVER